MLHVDLMGPMRVQCLGRKKYILRFKVLCFQMMNKNEFSVRKIRNNRGNEFVILTSRVFVRRKKLKKSFQHLKLHRKMKLLKQKIKCSER